MENHGSNDQIIKKFKENPTLTRDEKLQSSSRNAEIKDSLTQLLES